MEVKIEIMSKFGNILFEYSKENNKIKDTLIEAIKRDADLRGAYLGDAYLGGADLGGANLGDANLRGADLRGANLVDANLRGAYLGGAYLVDANLRGAYLGGADLRGANLVDANLGDAGKLSSADDVLIVGPIGSRSAYTQIYRTDNGIYVKCGCFFGTISEFASKVHETHQENKYERDYNNLINYAKIRFGIE